MKTKAIIGQFYNNLTDALIRVEQQKVYWRGKVGFGVLKFSQGYMVLSENAIRSCGISFPFKNRRYENR